MYEVDVLFCDWMNSLLHKTGHSEIFPFVQSKVGALIPPIARLHVVGISVNESLVKSLIPPSTFVDTNTSLLVEAAYRKVYHGNWSNALMEEVTDVEEIAKYDIQNTGKPENLHTDFSLRFCLTAQVNGLLIYVNYETEKRDVIISSKESQFFGQSFILLSKPIKAYEKGVMFGEIEINWNESIRVAMQSDESDDRFDTEFFLL